MSDHTGGDATRPGLGDLEEALNAARAMPDGDGKVATLERLVERADAAGDDTVGVAVRFELIQAYNETSGRSRMLAPFAWCLAAYDRDPSLFGRWDAEMLRWYHKWAITTLLTDYRVSLPQTMAALDDMERRFVAGGHSLNIIYALRSRVASHIGDQAQAQHWFEQWRIAPRDENSDCEGCDPTRQATMLASWGRNEEAVAIVEPVLTGAVGCNEQPERAFAELQVIYLRLGRFEEAAKAHVRSYRRHRHEQDATVFIPDHLMFCGLSGHHERGLDLLDEHLARLDHPYDDFSTMEFMAAGALVTRLAIEAGSVRQVAGQSLPDLHHRLATGAREQAARFDTRNGTDHQSRNVERMMAEQPLTKDLALPPDEPRREVVVPPPDGREDLAVPLSTEAITAALQEREDRYRVSDDGTVSGDWGSCRIIFARSGEAGEILQIRTICSRGFPVDRSGELFEFVNSWNHDKLLPKAYVHVDEGEALLVGEANTDLEHGVTQAQLGVLMHAAIMSGCQFADAAAALP